MALVKLILLEDVENLGLAGDEVNVAPGYARNFLLPRGLASKSTPSILKVLNARKEKIEEHRRQEFEAAKKLAESIAAVEISIAMQASDDNRLFGSVTGRNIAEQFAAKGVIIDHQRVRLEEPIKQLGKFEVEIKLHHDVSVKAKVWIVRV
jgi:large subunit ribosomal protein L9